MSAVLSTESTSTNTSSSAIVGAVVGSSAGTAAAANGDGRGFFGEIVGTKSLPTCSSEIFQVLKIESFSPAKALVYAQEHQ